MDRRRLDRRNFLFLTLEGTFFLFGYNFLDPNAVVPVFIDAYTGNLQLAGLTSTLRMTLFFLPQFFIGPLLLRVKNITRFAYLFMLLFRPIPLLMVPILLAGWGNRLTVLIFIILYALLWIEEGIIATPWMEVFSRTIVPEVRGRLLGMQQFFSGVCGIFGGYLIKMVLEDRTLPDSLRFALIFGAGGLFMTLGACFMFFVKDTSKGYTPVQINLKEYFRQMPERIRENSHFRSFLIVLSISAFTGMVMPFIVLFGKSTFQLAASEVSTLVYIQIIGTLAGGILWGGISQKLGNRQAIAGAQLVGLVINGLAVLCILMKAPGTPTALLWILAFLAGVYSGNWLGYVNYVIEVAREEVRTVYLVIYNLVSFPFSFLFYLAGLAAGAWGFLPVFLAGGAAAATATILAVRLKSPQPDT